MPLVRARPLTIPPRYEPSGSAKPSPMIMGENDPQMWCEFAPHRSFDSDMRSGLCWTIRGPRCIRLVTLSALPGLPEYATFMYQPIPTSPGQSVHRRGLECSPLAAGVLPSGEAVEHGSRVKSLHCECSGPGWSAPRGEANPYMTF
jgi:hypothetical protein